ncbi:MAG TPA: ankyrin repeat domain-containing protein, partial [Longimicrobiales bacterium]|nr:ankyrin repeat domain-containing protein [Longimicrobiales bacterium]
MRKSLRPGVVTVLALAALLSGAAAPDSPVADAAMEGDAERVRSLVRQGVDVNGPQGDGMTALHWAARHGDADMAGVLLGAGADVRAVTRIGAHTPLHVAARGGSEPVVRALLAAGADPAAATTTGVTPLHLAALAGEPGAIAALLDHGAPAGATEPEWGQTPLMLAAAQGRAEAVRVLLERGADPSVTARVVDLVERASVDAA